MKTMMKRLGAAGLVAGLALVPANPASAHTQASTVSSSGFVIGSARPSSDHRSLTVCDTRADGAGVHAEYYTTIGGPHTLGDPNGQAQPCGFGGTADGGSITRMRVCATGYGCGSWVYH